MVPQHRLIVLSCLQLCTTNTTVTENAFFKHCDSFKGNKYKQCIIQCILLYYIDRNPKEFKFLKNFVVLPSMNAIHYVALFIQNVLFLPLPIAKKSCIDFETQ